MAAEMAASCEGLYRPSSTRLRGSGTRLSTLIREGGGAAPGAGRQREGPRMCLRRAASGSVAREHKAFKRER